MALHTTVCNLIAMIFILPSSLTSPASKSRILQKSVWAWLSTKKMYFLHAGVSYNLPSVTTPLSGPLEVACNTTALLRCRGRLPYPLWYLNETLTESPQYTVKNPGENEFVGELTISGNATCGILDLRCTERSSTVYIISSRLTVQGLYYI